MNSEDRGDRTNLFHAHNISNSLINVGTSPEPRSLKILALGPAVYVASEGYITVVARLSNEGGVAIKVLEVSLIVDGCVHQAALRSQLRVVGFEWFDPPDVRIDANDGVTGAWYFGSSWAGASDRIRLESRKVGFRLLAQHTEPIGCELEVVDYVAPESTHHRARSEPSK